MAARIGRKVAVTWAGVRIAAREKSVTFNGEPIDVSDDNSNGYRELLDEVGEVSVDLSISGLAKSNVLRIAGISKDARTQTLQVTYPDGGILSGTFMLTSYSEAEPYKDAATFEASFQSNGAVTYTPGP